MQSAAFRFRLREESKSSQIRALEEKELEERNAMKLERRHLIIHLVPVGSLPMASSRHLAQGFVL